MILNFPLFLNKVFFLEFIEKFECRYRTFAETTTRLVVFLMKLNKNPPPHLLHSHFLLLLPISLILSTNFFNLTLVFFVTFLEIKFWKGKELSLCHNLNCSIPIFFASWWYFKFRLIDLNSLKCLRSTTLGFKDLGMNEFGTKNHRFFNFSLYCNFSLSQVLTTNFLNLKDIIENYSWWK